jgi:hypothetical protein
LTFRTPAASTSPRHGGLHSLNAEYRGDFVFVTRNKLTRIQIDPILELSSQGTTEGFLFQSTMVKQNKILLSLKLRQLLLFNTDKRDNVL